MATATETVRMATQGQILDIAATIIVGLPELTFEDAQRLIGMKKKLNAKASPALLQVISELLGKASDPTPSASQPVEPNPPTEITLGGVTFDLLPFTEGKPRVSGKEMLAFGNREKADMDEETGLHVEKYWADIPLSIRQKHYFAFPLWRDARGFVVFLCDSGGEAYRNCSNLENDYWLGFGLLLRRRGSSSV